MHKITRRLTQLGDFHRLRLNNSLPAPLEQQQLDSLTKEHLNADWLSQLFFFPAKVEIFQLCPYVDFAYGNLLAGKIRSAFGANAASEKWRTAPSRSPHLSSSNLSCLVPPPRPRARASCARADSTSRWWRWTSLSTGSRWHGRSPSARATPCPSSSWSSLSAWWSCTCRPKLPPRSPRCCNAALTSKRPRPPCWFSSVWGTRGPNM